MNLKGNLTSKGLQGSIGKSRMQGILGTNPAAIPISVDNALSLSSTNPVQNKVITAAITNRLWSDEVKTALLQIVEKVAYVDEHGQDYYDALYNALYPPTNLDSIGAVFDSSATIYNTDTLDDLKPYLTVTAYYTDGTSETVTTYTLSGSMDAGTQTITVSYGGKTTTFSVTVVENSLVSISAVFTQGSAVIYDTDNLDTLRQYLVVTATYADSTTATVTDYTLSGTLTAGTSTITVNYGGKSDTFTVAVTKYWDIEWDYTDGNPVDNGWAATSVAGTMLNNGYQMQGSATAGCTLGHDDPPRLDWGKGIFEVNFTITDMSAVYQGICFFSPGMRLRMYGGKLWINYASTNTEGDQVEIGSISANTTYTIRWEYDKDSYVRVYLNDALVYTYSGALLASTARLFLNATGYGGGTVVLHSIRCKEVL